MTRHTLPNFVVVGPPKTGTTSLHNLLREHADVFVPNRKELHYFAAEELRRRCQGPGDRAAIEGIIGDLDEYLRHFASARQPAVGDVSPSYFFHAPAAHRIRALLGRPRIVILFRDPVERAYSQYLHMRKEGREQLPFMAALDAESMRRAEKWSDMWLYAESSRYSDGVARYVEVFGEDRVGIFASRDVFAGGMELSRLLAFLDVPGLEQNQPLERLNASSLPRSNRIAQWTSSGSALRKIARRFPRSAALVKAAVERLNSAPLPSLAPREEERLVELFRDDVRRLATRYPHLDMGPRWRSP